MGADVPVDETALAAEEYIKNTFRQDPASDGIIYDGVDMQDAFYAGAQWEREREK